MKPNIDSQRHTAKFQNSQMKKLFNQKYTPQELPQEVSYPMAVLQNIQCDQANRTTDLTQINPFSNLFT